MKAIVANVLFGGIFGCLGWAHPANSEPIYSVIEEQPQSNVWEKLTTTQSILSAQLFPVNPLPHVPLLSTADRVFSINLDSVKFNQLEDSRQRLGQKKPYIHEEQEVEFALGFQNTFWPNFKQKNHQKKYWGLTTIKNWGHHDHAPENLAKLDYGGAAPILSPGSSTLTFSGGGARNLAARKKLDSKDEFSQDFKDFRGGITYHHGLVERLTMGTGLIYEESLVSFTQLTYDAGILPIRTTVSLFNRDSKTDLHSHVSFRPDPNLTFNYYNQADQQKLDLKWKIKPGLKLTFNSETKESSHSKGLKVAINTDLLSISASASINHQQKLQWKLDSKIGGFKFIHNQSPQKSSSKLYTDLFQTETLNLIGSTFVKYQTKQVTSETQDFIIWGGKIRSTLKTNRQKPRWSLDLGYGYGLHGSGLVAEGMIALKGGLSLKVNYQSVSAKSDDTEFKIQLGAN